MTTTYQGPLSSPLPSRPSRQTFSQWLKNHPQANTYETLWAIQNVLSTVYLINDPEPAEAWLASDKPL